ncbi:MAG: CRISPR-associated endonuclease Cas2 [Cyanothece sp. SIO2G6]|nr:CRISPR-associated endonuclease Cas2 [Cyanothece sp. SIO2G6]
MLAIVVYDIPDNRRRTQLATFLEGYGRRVQRSVFECFLSRHEMQKLHQKIEQRVNHKEDNVRLYWISQDGLDKVLTVGSEPPSPPPSAYIL